VCRGRDVYDNLWLLFIIIILSYVTFGRRWARINLRKTVDGALCRANRAKCFVSRVCVVHREHGDGSAPKPAPSQTQRLCNNNNNYDDDDDDDDEE